jgi:hypothetical protein
MTVHSHITESPSGEWEKDWIPNAMMSQSLEPNCLPSFLPSFLPSRDDDVLTSQCQQRPLAIRKRSGRSVVYSEAAEGLTIILVVTESQRAEGERQNSLEQYPTRASESEDMYSKEYNA